MKKTKRSFWQWNITFFIEIFMFSWIVWKIWLFCEKKNKLRIIIFQCLRKSVIIWHIIELSKIKNFFFRTITMIQWKNVLLHRFKKQISVVLIKLQFIRYSITNIKTEKNLRSFAQNIFRHVKTVHLNSIQNQLIMIWNILNCEFRFQIPKSTFINTIKQFFHDLNNHADIWHEIIKKRFYNSDSISFSKKTIYNKQTISSFCWKTKNRDFFKIMTDFMNLFSITDQIKYFFVYHNQNVKQDCQRKSDSNCAFDTKVITDLFFKMRFQITSKNESDFKKKKFFLKQKVTPTWQTTTKKRSIITNSIIKKINLNQKLIMKIRIHFQISSKKNLSSNWRIRS